jgi:2-furoyl-CoA dehydrogenase large subunit
MSVPSHPWVGRSIERVEDAALLTGRGRFIDDLGVAAGTLHAAILRSPCAHAHIRQIRTDLARAAPGVATVIVGADVARLTLSLPVAVKSPMQCWPIAIERVRYVGEPVAVVVASDRYLAEDAVDLIEVNYEALPALIDPVAATEAGAPVLHEGLGCNIASERSFCYGDPQSAFAAAPHRIGVEVRYPRNSCTPIETYGVVASYDPHGDAYDILSNFQGPFSIHAVIARALKVPGNRLRLRTPPDSGGSFGVKQGVFPYLVLMGVAARMSGRPVKWIEDRLEHLAASVSATNRIIRLDAAVDPDGRVRALAWDQLEDVGAYMRAPEPATLYRMHGNLTGAYDIRHISVRNRVIVSNKTPTGLNRGFGGPQVYYALERLMQRIAVELKLDTLEVIHRNLVPAGGFPYRTATGGLLDSGNYQQALEIAARDGGIAELRARREEARREGRLYGIGCAAVVEPSVSNMGYITTVLTPQQRLAAGPKNGAQATATIAIDPLGAVTVHIASVPQGQGHRTVVAQVIADELGLKPSDIQVIAEMDTATSAWSIASGNYASRFAAAVCGAAHIAAVRLKAKLARLAAPQLNVAADHIEFVGGSVRACGNPDNALPLSRLAAIGHWAPGMQPADFDHAIRETAFWTPAELGPPTPSDEINSSLCHGFIFDVCGVEVDRSTGAVRIDRYVTTHDCGRILNPAMVAGQITGGFAHALGAALYEEYAYAPDGSFLAGTFADYLVPTAMEVPTPRILHLQTPSPFTPLGAKGVGEGNCMSTPVCIANAVADALDLDHVDLPLTPAKLAAAIHAAEPPPPPTAGTADAAPVGGDRALHGVGKMRVAAAPLALWQALLDTKVLASIIPGCHNVEPVSPTHFRADVTLGVGPAKGRYRADVRLTDLMAPTSATLAGKASGALGFATATGHLRLDADGATGTIITYDYEAEIGGKIAAVGGRLLDGAARVIIRQFLDALAARVVGASVPVWRRSLAWLLRLRPMPRRQP